MQDKKMILRSTKCYSYFLFCVVVICLVINSLVISEKLVKYKWAKHDMKEVLEEAGLIPDVLDQAPLYELKVAFGDQNNAVVNFGNFLLPDDLNDEMSIYINTTAEHDSYYFLIMTDIDYPTPDSPDRREYIHWITMNIRGVDLCSGDVLTAYAPPGTNVHGPGIHRYVFYYIKQRSSGPILDPDYFDYALPLNRPEHDRRTNFSVNRFRKKYGLPRPIAVNFFRINWEVAEE